MTELFALSQGHGTPRVAFLHGLLGQGKNWATIAKGLGEATPSVLLDLPNHGRSPWVSDVSYPHYADLVADDLRARLGGQRLVLVGHSMGGKVAMALALRHPDLLDGLVIVDIPPDRSAGGYGFAAYLDAMAALPLDRLSSRGDADRRLAPSVADPAVRAFLLQNLHREGHGWRWLPNLAVLRRHIDAVSGWPEVIGRPWPGPVLWVRGAESPYVRDEHRPAMRALFPAVRLVTIKHAAHWVHADAPEAVTATLTAFLSAVSR